MSRVIASVEYLTHDSIAGVACGLGMAEYESETERLLLANLGEAAINDAARAIEDGNGDWYDEETASCNPLHIAKLVLQKESGL